MSDEGLLLTVSEFAVALHSSVSERTVRTMIHQGKIHAVKLGKAFYMTRDELVRFVSTCHDNENRPASFNEKTISHGSSSMKESKSGQDTVMDFVAKQKEL